MPIIYTSRNLSGSYGGDYTNGAWGSLMNSYAVRFTSATSGRGSSYNGSTFYFSGSVYFPYSGNYTVRAAADNSGSLNVAGRGCSVSGFGGSSSTTFYSTPGTKSISGSVYNAPSSNTYRTNPYGIAFTIDAPSRPPSPSVSISVSPSAIIQGQCATLSWSSSGVGIYYRNMSNISSSSSGSTTVCPSFSTQYFFDVRGEGGQTVRYVTLTVYIPPVLNIQVSKTTLIAGQCANISWSVSGDGDRVIWTSGNIANQLVTSSVQVCPAVTTTYSGYATGNGGTSPTASVTIYVYQVPVINEFNVPESLNYGENGNIEYDVSYANLTVEIQKIFNYNTYTSDQGTTSYPVCGTAELDGPNPTIDNTIGTGVVYDNFGPRSVTYVLSITGNGGSQMLSKTVPIIIDEEMDNLNVQETDGKFQNEEPVYTKDVLPEDTTLSDMYLVNGIDIPVEIKSDYAISVRKNDGEFENVRQIGTGFPAGSSEPVEDLQVAKVVPNGGSLRVASPVDEEEFNLATQASSSLTFSDGTTSKTIIQGQSVTFSWYVTGYASASISPAPGVLSITSGSAVTYSVQNIKRWFSTTPAPGDHMCSATNPGGYASEGTLFKSFTTQAPGTFLGYDNESSVKPYATIGYIYPFNSSGHPVGTTTIYEKIDPAGGPPNGFGTIWTTSSSGEGPYTGNGPNQGFKAPTSGYTDSSSITFSGSSTQTPLGTTTYTLSTGGSITVTVLVPPTLVITATGLDANNTITAGQQFTITWYTTGTTPGVTWTAGTITNGLNSSSQTFTAADTITFTGYARDGGAGASPSVTLTVRVVQIPTFEWSVPEQLDYGDDLFVGFESEYANISINITPTYIYADGTTTVGTTLTYGPAQSAEIGGTTAFDVESTQIPVPYNSQGPEQVQLVAQATGEGGSQIFSELIPVNIDRTPDGIIIEEKEDAFKDQEPVFSPDVVPEDIIESQLYEINGIDVPVKVKSNYPIQIQVNQDGDWDNVEQI